MTRARLSVVIPTWRRVDRLLATLEALALCDPAPDEIIVHADANDTETAPAVAARFPEVRVLTAETRQGPGGARNRLLRESRHEIVVSLDDDSYPLDRDFFATVLRAFDTHPKAGVLAMTIIHDDEAEIPRQNTTRQVADFVGCGCAYRRSAFLETAGYLPLHPAYGMEEADVALQMLDRGWQIIELGDLRIRHATNRDHQTSRQIVAAHVRNTALLAFLRYPSGLALYGVAQVLNRARYSLGRRHVAGVLLGLAQIPATLWQHRAARSQVRAETVRARRALRQVAGT